MMCSLLLAMALFFTGQAEFLHQREKTGVELWNLENGKENILENMGKSDDRWDPEDVPYFIDPSLEVYSDVIEASIKEFEKVTCLRFRALQTSNNEQFSDWPKDYILFNNSRGCGSTVGRQGGPQIIGLQAESCTYKGPTMHHIYHTLGFRHEHNRHDRNQAIKIFWDNVDPDMRNKLRRYNSSVDMATYGESYDYKSLLHGDNYLYAINKSQPTMEARNDSSLELGQWDRLSQSNIRRLNAHYSCDLASTSTTTSTTPYTTPSTPVTRTLPAILNTRAKTTSTTTLTSTLRTTTTTSTPVPTNYGTKCNGQFPSYPDATDCTKFYQCFGTTSLVMQCPQGLYYNPTIYVCDWPMNVDCNSDESRKPAVQVDYIPMISTI